MLKRLSLQIATAIAALTIAPMALASGGNYVFDGGTSAEQAQVTAALNASTFPWGIVPGQVVVHIHAGLSSSAAPQQISLDANLLDAGSFSWGVVQHEYAHVVDFALLTPENRAALHTLLGGSTWSGSGAHETLDCERFADLVAWSYWMSDSNVMKPASATDEGGQVAPSVFRAALAAILPGLSVVKAQATRAPAAVAPRAHVRRKA